MGQLCLQNSNLHFCTVETVPTKSTCTVETVPTKSTCTVETVPTNANVGTNSICA